MPSLPLEKRTVTWLIVLAAIASVLQGLVFWTRRVGLLQPETYWHTYWQKLAEAINHPGEHESFAAVLKFGSTLHHTEGWLWVLTKGLKELVWLGIMVLIVLQLRHLRLPRSMAVALGGLFALTAISALAALIAGRWIAVFAGVRSSLSWVLAAAGARLADPMVCRQFARAFVWVLVLQAVLVPFEMHYGLTMFWMDLGGHTFARPVGTFNLPTSLGAFTVITWAMAVSWGQYRGRDVVLITALTAFVLVANASATAWVAWALAIGGSIYFRFGRRVRITLLLASLPMLIAGWLALPHITGRYDVHDSLWGRIYPVQVYAQRNLSTVQTLFGYRFGVGANAYATLTGAETHSTVVGAQPVGDSTPAAMFWQVGVLGVAFGYALILIALLRAPRSRPLGFALLVSSLTLNVTEHFPLNLILGVWLANSARAEHMT